MEELHSGQGQCPKVSKGNLAMLDLISFYYISSIDILAPILTT